MPKALIARRISDDSLKNDLNVVWSHENLNVQLAVKIYGSVDFLDGREPAESPELYTPSLSRSEINSLIKTLRRARDQVYGKDE